MRSLSTPDLPPHAPPSAQAAAVSARGRAGAWLRRAVAGLLLLSALVTAGYTALCTYVAVRLVYITQSPITKTPAALGLRYQDVTFASRTDHVTLRGWFIPGVLPDGSLTARRTIIMVHGARTNRADLPSGALYLSGDLARHGFAVLAFDMRGNGESAPAPFTFGYFEQRDVLGAVDFLRSGPLPYPELGRPRAIAGWGVSTGASTLLLAAAQEPAIRAVVSDCAFADAIPIVKRQLPEQGGLPSVVTPGALAAAYVLYGANYYAVRPVDVVARIAPRPLFFIHGAVDSIIPPSNLGELYRAARAAPDARVQEWLVAGADHAQSFHTAGEEYVNRVVAFYDAALGPDR